MQLKRSGSKFFNIGVKGCIVLFLLGLMPKTQAAGTAEADEGFNAGETILEHVEDAYEWHILTIKDKHVSIPLPVILIDNGKLQCFCSSHLHHGENGYKDYAICPLEGGKKGRIVKVKELDGEMDSLALSEASVFTVGDRPVTVDNEASLIDLSITKNVCSLFFAICLLLWLVLSAARNYRNRGELAPKGVARIVELLVVFVKDDVVKPAIGPKYQKFLPFLLTVFFFIFFNNLLGIIPFFPGGANLTGNIAVTLVLAMCTFVLTNINGTKHYWVDIVNTPGVPWWLKIPLPIMPVVEIVGVFTKPIVLMIRLFANITAGHIICLGFICIIFIFGASSPAVGLAVSPLSVLFYVFMSALECLVAYIQAYVFTLLSAIYIGLAVAEPHHEHQLEAK